MTNLLLLDLDGTLIDRAAGFQRWAAEFLRSIGRQTDDEMTWLVDVDADGLASREELFSALRERYDLPGDIPALVDTYLADFPPMIPAAAPDTLSALRDARDAGCALCILTNGGTRTQERKISRDLASAVDAYVISGSIGVEKPDPAAFEAAAAAVGRRLAEDSWMIGDRPETDVLGAVNSGIRSAWLRRDETWDETLPYVPTIEVADVREAISKILADQA